MKISIILEGQTEKGLLHCLKEFLKPRLPGQMPKIDPVPCNGRIPKGNELRQMVNNLLHLRREPADAVIALTDVYTGSQPVDFQDADDAKAKMRAWVGANNRFYPHAAQYDFEAWLLPYWERIQQLAKSNRASPGPHPERINHGNPPSFRLKEVFLTGRPGRAYVKPRDAERILKDMDLLVAADACPEFKAFLNTILKLSGGENAMI